MQFIRIHTNDRPFVCDVYKKKRFSQKHSLNSHKIKHTGDKPFGCDTCGKVFSNSSNRHRHLRTHKQQK